MDTVVINGGAIEVLPETAWAMKVHNAAGCAGRTCVIHNPTEHSMRDFELHWRGDRGIFERLCPHGIGHPDPNQQAYWREVAESSLHGLYGEPVEPTMPEEYVSAQMTHGCDGCCR